MADRELAVKINLGVGRNDADGALRAQGRAADELGRKLAHVAELQRRIAALAAMRPAEGTAVAKRLHVLRERLAEYPEFADNHGRLPPPKNVDVPGGVRPETLTPIPEAAKELTRKRQLLKMRAQVPDGQAREEWQAAFDAAVAQEEAAREAARKKSLAGLAHFRLTGRVPEGEIAAGQSESGRGAMASAFFRLGMSAPGVASQILNFNRPSYGNQLAGVGREGDLLAGTIGLLPGPLGMAAQLAGAFGRAVSDIGEAFKHYMPTLAEQISLLRERQGLVGGARGTGLVSGEQFRNAFQGTNVTTLLQAPGRTTGQNVNLLRAQHIQAGLRMRELEGLNIGAERSRLEALLMQARNAARAGGDPFSAQAGSQGHGRYLQLAQAYQRLGIRPGETPANLERLFQRQTGRELNDAEIRQIAEQMTTGRFTMFQARHAVTGAALRGGLLPNLRPGAPGLESLPGLFSSRQSDVLDLHGQVQQEAVRDQRQQAQFEAQMRLWTQILESLQALRFEPAAVD